MSKLTVFSVSLCCSGILWAQTPGQIDFFEKQIRPILAGNCAVCHTAKAPVAGIDFSTTEGIRYAVQYGGEAGELISAEETGGKVFLHGGGQARRGEICPRRG